jgi:hypothetical protein
MASETKNASNRRNAAKSSGPKSPQGKEITRTNALKNGVRAESVVIPGESSEEFEVLYRSLEEHYQPVGTAETLLLQQVVHCTWRLQRLWRIETGILRKQHSDLELERAKEELYRAKRQDDEISGKYLRDLVESSDEDEDPSHVGNTEDDYEPQRLKEVEAEVAKAEKAYREAYNEAEALSKSPLSPLAIAYLQSAKELENLSRYETTMERRLRNATHDLQRMQTDRTSAAANAAKVIDVPIVGDVIATAEVSQPAQMAKGSEPSGQRKAPRRRWRN